MSSANGDLVVGRAGDTPLTLVVSRDRGQTWTSLPRLPVEEGVTVQDKIIGCLAIDPGPGWDPAQTGGRWRVLLAGRSGVYIYESTGTASSQGQWRRSDRGMSSCPAEIGGRWLNQLTVDPRPGRHAIIYAASGPLDNCDERDQRWPAAQGSLPYHQLYRSLDGGETWQSLCAPMYQGIPDHLAAQAIAVSPASGRFYLQEWSGQYSLPAP